MLGCVRIAAAVGIVGLGLPVVTAHADDMDKRAWNGFSVSVGGGASKPNTDLDTQGATSETFDLSVFGFQALSVAGQALGASSTGTDEWEGFGTVQLAYDNRVGNFVVGGLIDFDFYPGNPGNAVSDTFDGAIDFGVFGNHLGAIPVDNYVTLSSSIELKSVWSVGGRLGYVVAPNTLIYGLGGYSQARLEGQADLEYVNVPTFAPAVISARAPDKLHGFFLGAGGEFLVSDGLVLRLEYRYANYRGKSVSSTGAYDLDINAGIVGIEFSQSASAQADIDAHIHSVRGAIVLQLGQP